MIVSEINPHIRFAEIIRITRQPRDYCAYDHRLFFVMSGKGSIRLAENESGLSEGSSIIIPSGTSYCFSSDEPLDIISINFDYTMGRSDIVEPLHVTVPSELDESRILERSVPDELNRATVIMGTGELSDAYGRMISEFAMQKKHYREIASAELKSVLIRLMRYSAVGYRAESKVNSILGYIREHYAENITNDRLSEVFGYHKYHLNRLMKASTGMTLHRYICFVRMDCAARLLSESELSVTEIARSCGYENLSGFSRDFKSRMGYTPLQYRERTKIFN